jgi:hypothetical protein
LLQWRDVDLSERPYLHLRPEATKSKRADDVPLNADICARLGGLKQLRPFAAPTDPVFPSVPKLDRWLLDLKAASIPYRNAAGQICGFHSLRVTLGSRLERAGVPVKARMQIMRHTDPKVSYGSYADVALLDVHGAVERACVTGTVNEVLRTGTDDQVVQKRVQLGDVSGRLESALDGKTGDAQPPTARCTATSSGDFANENGVEGKNSPSVTLLTTTLKFGRVRAPVRVADHLNRVTSQVSRHPTPETLAA